MTLEIEFPNGNALGMLLKRFDFNFQSEQINLRVTSNVVFYGANVKRRVTEHGVVYMGEIIQKGNKPVPERPKFFLYM